MKQEQFLSFIGKTSFFENVGSAIPEGEVVALSSLAPWGDEASASQNDLQIADQMEWLPTTRNQDDPFYPDGVIVLAGSPIETSAVKKYQMDVYKAVLRQLRNADVSQLKAGSHNFEVAAKGSAAFAFRNAAAEIALGINGKWTKVVDIYFRGNWPCGISNSGELVIV